MPFPIRHKLLTVIGTSWLGAEEFSFSMRIIPPIGSLTVSQAQVDALAASTSTFFASANTGIATHNKMTAIKLAPIATDGLYPPGEDSFEHIYAPVISGGSTVPTVLWPPQCSYSIGLLTAASRGRGHIGRFYLPTMGYTVSTATGGVGDLVATVGAAARTWINAINATADVGTVGVLSSLGSGASRVVTAVRCGSIVDTQRRRRRQLNEVYTQVAL